MEGTTAYVLATSECEGGGGGDSIQVTALDDTAPVGTIVQYIGPTTATATNGLFYKKETTGWVKATIENEVTGSFDVKNGNVYVTHKDPEGDRAGIMMGIQGGNAIVSTSGNTNSLLLDSMTVETQDDLKVNGYLYVDQVYATDGKDKIEINNDTLVDGKLTVNSGVVVFNDDETVVETGEQGHVYFKKGVTIGTDAEDKHKSLEVNGTVRIYNHDIYGHGAQFEESVLADGSLTSNRGVNSRGATNLGDINDTSGGDINFFPSYTETKLSNGRKRVQSNCDELAFMTIQKVGTKNIASLQMNDGRVVAHTLKTDVLDSATSSGRIDVKTELHLDSVMETRKVEVKGGYPIIVYDYAGNQSVKLSSNGGAIFCGDVHGDGYADRRHDLDGFYNITADKYRRYVGSEIREVGKHIYFGRLDYKNQSFTLPTNYRSYAELAFVVGDYYGATSSFAGVLDSIHDYKKIPLALWSGNNMNVVVHCDSGVGTDYTAEVDITGSNRLVKWVSGSLAVHSVFVYGVC